MLASEIESVDADCGIISGGGDGEGAGDIDLAAELAAGAADELNDEGSALELRSKFSGSEGEKR